MNKNIMLLLFTLFSLILAACAGTLNQDSNQTSAGQKLSIKAEYEQKQAELNSAIAEMNIPLQKWNDFMQRIKEGGSIYASDLQDTYFEFVKKTDNVKKKIAEFSSFTEKNRDELYEAKIDIDKAEKEINVISSYIELNLESMKQEISMIPQQ